MLFTEINVKKENENHLSNLLKEKNRFPRLLYLYPVLGFKHRDFLLFLTERLQSLRR